MHGNSNVSIPLYIGKRDQDPLNQAFIRFSLSYKVGGTKNPGNIDEKIRCEAATFIYINDNFPELPSHNYGDSGLLETKAYAAQ